MSLKNNYSEYFMYFGETTKEQNDKDCQFGMTLLFTPIISSSYSMLAHYNYVLARATDMEEHQEGLIECLEIFNINEQIRHLKDFIWDFSNPLNYIDRDLEIVLENELSDDEYKVIAQHLRINQDEANNIREGLEEIILPIIKRLKKGKRLLQEKTIDSADFIDRCETVIREQIFSHINIMETLPNYYSKFHSLQEIFIKKNVDMYRDLKKRNLDAYKTMKYILALENDGIIRNINDFKRNSGTPHDPIQTFLSIWKEHLESTDKMVS